MQVSKINMAKRKMSIRTDLGGVVGGTEDKFRRAIVARADVRDIGLVLDQDLSTAKVAELQYASSGIKQEILRLDVAVADALRVNVRQGAEELVGVELHLNHGHGSLHFVEVARRAVDGLGDIFENQVEVHFILLLSFS